MEVNIELAKKLLKEKYFINGDNGIRTQNPIRVEDLAFIMQKYTDEQLRINGVVKSLKGKKAMSFGIWKMKCKDIEYIDRNLVKYKGHLMSYEDLEKEYYKIKHTL